MLESKSIFKKIRKIQDEEFGIELHDYCALLSTPLKDEYVYCEGGDCRKCVIPLYAAMNGNN